MNWMVEVPPMFDVLKLEIVRLLSLPVAFTRPSMVTLSAPLRLIKRLFEKVIDPPMFPEMVNPGLVG